MSGKSENSDSAGCLIIVLFLILFSTCDKLDKVDRNTVDLISSIKKTNEKLDKIIQQNESKH